MRRRSKQPRNKKIKTNFQKKYILIQLALNEQGWYVSKKDTLIYLYMGIIT